MSDINFRKSSTSTFIDNLNSIESTSNALIQEYKSVANYISYEQDEQSRESFHIENSRTTGYSFELELINNYKFGRNNGGEFIPSDFRVKKYYYKKYDNLRNVITREYWDSPVLKKVATLDSVVNATYHFYQDLNDIYNTEIRALTDFEFYTTPESLVHYNNWEEGVGKFAAYPDTRYFFKSATLANYFSLFEGIKTGAPAGNSVSDYISSVPANDSSVILTGYTSITDGTLVLIKDDNENYVALAKVIVKDAGTNRYSFEVMVENGILSANVKVYQNLGSLSTTMINTIRVALVNKLKAIFEEWQFYINYSSFYEPTAVVKAQNILINTRLTVVLSNIETLLNSVSFEVDYNATTSATSFGVYGISGCPTSGDRSTAILNTLKDIANDVFEKRWEVIRGTPQLLTEGGEQKYVYIGGRLDKAIGTLVSLVKSEKGFDLLERAILQKQASNNIIENNFTVKKILLDADNRTRVFVSDISNLSIKDEIYIISNGQDSNGVNLPEIKTIVVDIVKARVPTYTVGQLQTDVNGFIVTNYDYAYKIIVDKIIPTSYLTIDQLRIVIDKKEQNSPNISTDIYKDTETSPPKPWYQKISWTKPVGIFSNASTVYSLSDFDLTSDKVRISIFIDKLRANVNSDLSAAATYYTTNLSVAPPVSSFYYCVGTDGANKALYSTIEDFSGIPLDYQVLNGNVSSVIMNFLDGDTYYIGINFSENAGFGEKNSIISFTPPKEKVSFNSTVGTPYALGVNDWKANYNISIAATNRIRTSIGVVISFNTSVVVGTNAPKNLGSTSVADWSAIPNKYIDVTNDIDCRLPMYVTFTPIIDGVGNNKKYEALPITADAVIVSRKTTPTFTPTVTKLNNGITMDFTSLFNSTVYTIGDITYTQADRTHKVSYLNPQIGSRKYIEVVESSTGIIDINVSRDNLGIASYSGGIPTVGTENIINLYSDANYLDIEETSPIYLELGFSIEYKPEFFITPISESIVSSEGKKLIPRVLLAQTFGEFSLSYVAASPVFEKTGPSSAYTLKYSHNNTINSLFTASATFTNYSLTTTKPSELFGKQLKIWAEPDIGNNDWYHNQITDYNIITGKTRIDESPTVSYVLTNTNGIIFTINTGTLAYNKYTYLVNAVEVGFITSASYRLTSQLTSNSTPTLRSEGKFLHSESWTKTFTGLNPEETLTLLISFDTEDNGDYVDISYFTDVKTMVNGFVDNVHVARKQNSIDPLILITYFESREHGFTLKIGDYYNNFNDKDNIFWNLDNSNSWISIKDKTITYPSLITDTPLLPSITPHKIYFKGGGNSQYYPTDKVNAIESSTFPVLINNNSVTNYKEFVPLKKKVIANEINKTITPLVWGFKIEINELQNTNIEKIIVKIDNGVFGTYDCIWNAIAGKYATSNIGYIDTTGLYQILPSSPHSITFEAIPTVGASVDYSNVIYSFGGLIPLKKSVTIPTFEVSTVTQKQITVTLMGDFGGNNEFAYKVYKSTDLIPPTDPGIYTPSSTYTEYNLKDGTNYRVKIWYRNSIAANYNINTFGSIVAPALYTTKFRVGERLDNFGNPLQDTIFYKTAYTRLPIDVNFTSVSYNITFSEITCANADSILANGIEVINSGTITLLVNEGDTIQLSLVASNTNAQTHYNTITEVYRVAETNKFGNTEVLREISNINSNFITFISRTKELTSKLTDYFVTEITADTISNGRDLSQINYWKINIPELSKTIQTNSQELIGGGYNSINNPITTSTPEFKIYSDGINKNKLYVYCSTKNAAIIVSCYGSPIYDAPNVANSFTMNYLNINSTVINEFYSFGKPTTRILTTYNTDIFKNNPLVEYDVASEPNYNSITLDLVQSFFGSNGIEEPNYYEIEYRKLTVVPKIVSGSFSKLTYSPTNVYVTNPNDAALIKRTADQTVIISGLKEATAYIFKITPKITGLNSLRFHPGSFSRTVIFYTKGKMGVVETIQETHNDTRLFKIGFGAKNIYKLKVDRDSSLPLGTCVADNSKIITYKETEGYTLLDSIYPADLENFTGDINEDTSVQFNYYKTPDNALWEDISGQYIITDKRSDNSDVDRRIVFDWVIGKDNVVVSMVKNKILLTTENNLKFKVDGNYVNITGTEYKILFGTGFVKEVTVELYLGNIGDLDDIVSNAKISINGVENNATYDAGLVCLRTTFQMEFKTLRQNFSFGISHPNYISSPIVRAVLYSNTNLNWNTSLVEDAFKNDYFYNENDSVSSLVITKDDLLDIGSYDYTYGQFEITNFNGTFYNSTSGSHFIKLEEQGKVIFRPNGTVQDNSNNLTSLNVREGIFKIRLIPKTGLEEYFNSTAYVSKTYKFYSKKTVYEPSLLIEKTDTEVYQIVNKTIPLKNKKVYEFFIAGLVSGHGGGGGRGAYWGHKASYGGSGGSGQVNLFSNEWKKKTSDDYPDDIEITTTLQKGMSGTNGIGLNWETNPPTILWESSNGSERNTEVVFNNSVIKLDTQIAAGGSRGQSGTRDDIAGYTMVGIHGLGYYEKNTNKTEGVSFWQRVSGGNNGSVVASIYNIIFDSPDDGGYRGQKINLKKDVNGRMAGTSLAWQPSLKKESKYLTLQIPNKSEIGYGGDGYNSYDSAATQSGPGEIGGKSIAAITYYYKQLILDNEVGGLFSTPAAENFVFNANDSVFSYYYVALNVLQISFGSGLIKDGNVLNYKTYDSSYGAGAVVSEGEIYSGGIIIDNSKIRSIKYFYKNLYGNTGASKIFNIVSDTSKIADTEAYVTFSPIIASDGMPSATISATSLSNYNNYSIYFKYKKIYQGAVVSLDTQEYSKGVLTGNQTSILNNGSYTASGGNGIRGNFTNGFQNIVSSSPPYPIANTNTFLSNVILRRGNGVAKDLTKTATDITCIYRTYYDIDYPIYSPTLPLVTTYVPSYSIPAGNYTEQQLHAILLTIMPTNLPYDYTLYVKNSVTIEWYDDVDFYNPVYNVITSSGWKIILRTARYTNIYGNAGPTGRIIELTDQLGVGKLSWIYPVFNPLGGINLDGYTFTSELKLSTTP